MKHIENSDADARLWEAIVAHEGEIFVRAGISIPIFRQT